jgi:hypothetical protein
VSCANGIFSQLGFGRFNHELAIKTIDHYLRLTREYGTLIPIEELISSISKSSGADPSEGPPDSPLKTQENF